LGKYLISLKRYHSLSGDSCQAENALVTVFDQAALSRIVTSARRSPFSVQTRKSLLLLFFRKEDLSYLSRRFTPPAA
jgi:hypothetical protein